MKKHLCIVFILLVTQIKAVTITSTATGGTFSVTTTWVGGVVPGLLDDAVIATGATVTVTDNRNCLSVTLNGASSSTNLIINSGVKLTITNAVTINPPTGGTNDNTIAVGAGILSCATFSTTNSGNNNRRCVISISTGTLTCSGNFSLANNTTQNKLTFTSSGLMQLGGSTNTLLNAQFTASTGTVEYNMAGAQSILALSYYTLKCSTSGTKTLLANTTMLGSLLVTGNAQLDVDATNNYNLIVGGNWTISSISSPPVLTQSATVTFNGTSGTQSLTTTASQENFYNLTISNTSGSSTGISLDKNLTINNIFILNTGTVNIGAFNLASTGTTNINAGGIIGTGSITCSGAKVIFGTTSGGPTIVPTVSITTSSITMQRGTFSNAVNVTKISSSSITDTWRGGNTFNGIFTLNNAAVGDTLDPDGDIYLGGNTSDPTDVFNANSYFYVTGCARIRCPQNGTATFNAPAHFYSQGFASTSKGSYDRIQPARFSPAAVTFNDSAIFFCSSNTTDIYIAYDAGTTATFNKPVIATHGGTSQANFYFGGSGTINLNDDVYFNNTGSGTINIINASDGIATLASGKKLLVGSKGFISGSLTVWNFTQLGSTPQSLTFTGSAIMNIGGNGTPCTFNAPVAFSSPNINLTQNLFKGTTNSFTMSGTTNQNCYGGNTFASGTTNTFVNSSSGYWRLGNTRGDTCKGNMIYKRASTGLLSPAYNNTNYFYGNITIASGSDSINFASSTGIVNLVGTSSASFTSSGSKGTSMKQITMNKTGGASFTLNNNVGMPSGGTLILTSGLLNSSSSGYLFFMDETCTVPALTDASTSYINGPVRHDMSSTNTTQVLNFPIGKGSDCRPFILTTRHSAGTSFSYMGEVFNAPAPPSYTFPSTIDTVSGVHYWNIDRTVTSSGAAASATSLSYSVGVYPKVQLFFGTNDYVYQGANLTIVKNTAAAPTAWIDIGGSSSLGNFSTPQSGNVTSTSSPSAFNSFSTFTLGSLKTGWDPLPIELLEFSAIPNANKVDIKWETATETNNAYFTIEKSKDGINFTKFIDIPGAGNSTSYKNYVETDYQPYSGTSYYRLKQTDFNGNYKYFNVVAVNFDNQKNVVVYPNPIDNTTDFKVTVSGYKNQEVVVVLRDVQGNEFLSKVLVSQENNQTFIVDETHTLAPGTYIVTASSNDKIYNYKLIVK